MPTSITASAGPAQRPYSAFTKFEKWWISSLVAYAACFSTLSSFIYYPAIHLLSESLNVTVDNINLTITSYMAIATVAPMLVGDTADTQGRRPVYIMILGVYVASNIAIASTQSYPALLGLRVVQALAISGAFSVAYGVIADIASPAERGSYVSIVSFAITIAPTFGPILSGGLSYAAGWPWIFWFLAIAAGSCLVLVIFLLPETARKIVDNGSIAPPQFLRLPIKGIFSHWDGTGPHEKGQRKCQVPNPLKSLTILLRKDNTVIIMAAGLLYVVYTCVNAALSILFVDIYGLNQWQAGLIYLPFGLGGVVSTFFSGPLINGAYRRSRMKRGLTTDKVFGEDLDEFSIERARLSAIWAPMILTCISIPAFGWTVHYEQHISIPLIIQFVAGLCMQLDFSIFNTLLVDKNHRQPATAQASSNIVRCTFAAVTVAFLEDLLDALGIGWTFTFMGGLCLVSLGFFLLDYIKGTSWRQRNLKTRCGN
ncbi:multidrug resistance protein [Stachybotrys elegans]|uniref:Multidrug resistance protein n=1 Tax=Stachybotrys elegans TaxID=80388 RepID=A0A8K0SIS1_9HYPO|nr:multidrug resistance protein [Stachybotrys elegans]